MGFNSVFKGLKVIALPSLERGRRSLQKWRRYEKLSTQTYLYAVLHTSWPWC